MKVDLIYFTGKGSPDETTAAIDLMIFTKSTRLEMQPGLLENIKAWPLEKKMKELEYMANTIPSSWEFCDYTFLLNGVTRAFTHQLVRTRTASFAQQTMRVLDVSEGLGWGYLTGPTIPKIDNSPEGHNVRSENERSRHDTYHDAMEFIAQTYKTLIDCGVAIEDARGILPTNILTNIVVKMNMRTFVELVRKRSSSRTQGEYRDVLEAMKEEVRKVHPWIDLFINRDFDRAANELDELIRSEIEPAIGQGGLSKETATKMIKLLDQMRTTQ